MPLREYSLSNSLEYWFVYFRGLVLVDEIFLHLYGEHKIKNRIAKFNLHHQHVNSAGAISVGSATAQCDATDADQPSSSPKRDHPRPLLECTYKMNSLLQSDHATDVMRPPRWW
jgi:hypothetical protein